MIRNGFLSITLRFKRYGWVEVVEKLGNCCFLGSLVGSVTNFSGIVIILIITDKLLNKIICGKNFKGFFVFLNFLSK